MRLSIVVPALNEAAAIAGHLAALAPLRSRGVEVVVVDGGSDDATAQLAAPLADQVLHAPRGRALQMNAGARAARGDALLFLHADTRLPEGADRLVAQALARSDWGRFDLRIQGSHALLPVVAGMMNLRSRVSGIATGDQAMFMRKTAFESIGGFPQQALMEDIEASARLKQFGAPARIAEPVVTSGRRWERGGVLRTIVLMWRLRLAYFFGADPAELAQSYRRGER